jgi:hypothetical protein
VPGVRTHIVPPAAYRPGQDDVVVFDRWAPPEPPTRPAFYVAPPGTADYLGAVSGVVSDDRPAKWHPGDTHPILQGVDPLTMSIDRVRLYRAPALVAIARSERGTPLVYATEQGVRTVVLAFGPGDSNLQMAPGVPVLIANVVEWLGRPAIAGPHRPGPMRFDEAVQRVTDPAGKPVALERVNHAAIAELRVPGLYVAEGGGARSTVAVNVGDAQVSNVQRTLVPADRAHAVTAGASSHAWWVYCVFAAFALVLAEWWTWQRRITV